MSLSIALRGVASTLVGQFGQTVTITRRADGTYNTTTGKPAVNTVTQDVKVSVEVDRHTTVDGARVREIIYIIAAKDQNAPIKNGDEICGVDGKTVTVRDVELVTAQEQTVYHRVICYGPA